MTQLMPAHDDELRDAAVHFEAVRMRAVQDKDGWVLTIRLNPMDIKDNNLQEFLSDPVGQRYQVAMVRLTDDDQPGISPEQIKGKRLVTSAGMLCTQPDFQRWLYMGGHISELSEEQAAHWLRTTLGLESRAHLATAAAATKDTFRRIVEEYEHYLRDAPKAVERRR